MAKNNSPSDNDMAFTATNYRLLLIGLGIITVGFIVYSLLV